MKLFTQNSSYGTFISDLKIDGSPAPYGVVNEREVRVVAGAMFVVGLATFFFVVFQRQLWLMNFIIPLFWLEFFLKAVFGPHLSIFALFTRPLISNQTPDWVGAIQKRFAWSLGLVMATAMILVFFVFGIRGIAPMAICSICLVLMWLESSAGVCVGCYLYKYLVDKKIITQEKYKPVCAGGICSIQKEQ